MAKQGRPPKLSDEEIAVLKAIVDANPTATIDEISVELERGTGTGAHGRTIEKALSTAGIERRMDGSGVRVETNEEIDPRYGYTEAHRREQQPEQAYSSCLTDAEWELVSDLFESRGGRGKPPAYPRRLVLNACCYVVRTGCSRRMLPKSFPPCQNVYRTLRRWSAQGRFEQMHDRLGGIGASASSAPPSRARLCWIRSRRADRPREAITAMTPARRSRDANATWWSTPSDCCWP